MRRVLELEVACFVALRIVAHVGRVDDELDVGGCERGSELFRRSDAVGDGRRQRVVVQAARELPDRAGTKRVLRLDAEDELLEVGEASQRCHGPGERAGGRAVDPADARPERGLREALQEPELEQDPVDPSAGEDERDVASD